MRDITLRGLDPRILFASSEKDARVKPGQGEGWGIPLGARMLYESSHEEYQRHE
jgi:hypothetical protein